MAVLNKQNTEYRKNNKATKDERTKVYIIVALGVVFCLVGYFRFFYGSSDGTVGATQVAAPSAAAAHATAASAASPAAAPSLAPLTVPAINLPQAPHVKEPMRQAMVGEAVRDVFEPGKSVQRKESKPKVAAEAAPAQVQLTLSGMVYSSRNPVAIINGQFLRPGDRIGGYRVASIGPKEVYMKGDDREIVLRVTDHEEK
jgi:hypothetical protein